MQGLSKCESNPYIYVFPVLRTYLARSLIESISVAVCRTVHVKCVKTCSYMSSLAAARTPSSWQQINENVTGLNLHLSVSEALHRAYYHSGWCAFSPLLKRPHSSHSAATCAHFPLSNRCSARVSAFTVWTSHACTIKRRAGLAPHFEWSFTLSWHNRAAALWSQQPWGG